MSVLLEDNFVNFVNISDDLEFLDLSGEKLVRGRVRRFPSFLSLRAPLVEEVLEVLDRDVEVVEARTKIGRDRGELFF